MIKIIRVLFLCQIFLFFQQQMFAGELSVTTSETKKQNFKKIYFAGGCFWCMEESFDKIDGVISSISGYSGGSLKNPSYEDVIYKDTGHVETVEITYDSDKVTFNKLLDIYWVRILLHYLMF